MPAILDTEKAPLPAVKERPVVPPKDVDDALGSGSDGEVSDRRYGAGEAWAEGGRIEFYEPIALYEGRHRYDPKAEWTEEEEKRLVRKLDFRICGWACLMFFALQVDRGNITQALSDNMLGDLGLSTNEYNTGQTIFYLSFLASELPSQMVSKKIGVDVWIPLQMMAWSLVACCQSRVAGRASFFATRSLMGALEGGFAPEMVLYLSYFYKGRELPIRLSFFWGAYMATNIVAAFMATGLLQMRGVAGWAGWRWLFVVEGAFTFCIGVASWFYMPASPTETRGKGLACGARARARPAWFSEREEVIMVNRVLRDDPSKGTMHNRQGLTLRLLWTALCDVDLWPIYMLGLCWSLPSQPTQAYITLELKSMGFSTFQTSLLTVPGYSLFLVQLLFWTWLSERRKNCRMWTVIVSQFWMLPLVLALEYMPADSSPWARYACSTMLIGVPYAVAINVSLASRNSGSVGTRTVASALYNMCGQACHIIGANIYRKDDAPLYRKGNKALLAVIAWNMVLITSTSLLYRQKNKAKARIWDAMSQDEKDHYLATTKDTGSKRLDFRFAY